MLLNLLRHTDRNLFSPVVISLTNQDSIASNLRSLDVPVHLLGMETWRWPIAFARIINIVRQEKPDLVHTWMYHSNLMGALATRLAGHCPLVWGIHATNLLGVDLKLHTKSAISLSYHSANWLPDHIICCSRAALRLHVMGGFDPAITSFIPNGYDLSLFEPQPSARGSVRDEFGLSPDTPLLGMMARFHLNKDHETLFHAGRIIHNAIPDARIVCCGTNVTPENPTLHDAIQDAGVQDMVILAGRRSDVHRIDAALDLAVLSSRTGEAFPMTLGEAMACGVPCIATNVGDSNDIVGDTGRIVPPRDPEAFAAACVELLRMPEARRRELGKAARRRIEDRFSIQSVTHRHQLLYQRLIELRRRNAA